MISFPVSARALHQRRVHLRDLMIEGASLFPFFNGEGEVLSLMLVWPPARGIVVLDHRPGLARARFRGGVELDMNFAALRDVCAERRDGAAETGKLWHYDPWWVLREERYTGHPAVPDLKATNCVGAFLKPVLGCHFSRDLTSLVGITTESGKVSGLSTFGTAYLSFTSELLPERSVAARTPRPSREWTLDAFWLREGWQVPLSSSNTE